MKKTLSKRDIRKQIEQQMLDYLEQGGAVIEVDRGVSAYDPGTAGPSTTLFQGPRAQRTPLVDVVNDLDARRKPAKANPGKSKPKAPQKVPVYDDFGEVIRWVWQEGGGSDGD